MLPGAAQRRRRVADGSKPRALIACYDLRREETELCVYVLIEAQRATYIVQEETPKP